MKKSLMYALTVVLSFSATYSYAQQIAINEDGASPNLNAILDIKSFNKGILIPRMSTANRLAIPNTKGLLVYDTTAGSFWFNTGTAWQSLGGISTSGGGWLLTGNSGNSDSHFLGTVDNDPLQIKVNNVPSGRIDQHRHNTFWGYGAGSVTTGGSNTATGSHSLYHNTGGTYNTAVGVNALLRNTTGGQNTAIGNFSLESNITGIRNTAGGITALHYNTTGSGNTAFGAEAMASNTTGSDNTASGHSSLLLNKTGNLNTAIGTNALRENTRGDNNTAVGFNSLTHATTGKNNTALGAYSLSNNLTGIYNTAVGYSSLTSGDLNTMVGAHANVNIGGPLSNATAIGFAAAVNASNKVRIGNSAVAAIEGPVPFSTPSDGRFKSAIKEDVKGLDFILKLRPVTYYFDARRFDEELLGTQNDSVSDVINEIMKNAYSEAAAIRRSGFIAQEVENAAIETGYNFSGIITPKTEREHYSLSYESFVVPLVKAVQEQQLVIADLQKQLAELKQLVIRIKQ